MEPAELAIYIGLAVIVVAIIVTIFMASRKTKANEEPTNISGYSGGYTEPNEDDNKTLSFPVGGTGNEEFIEDPVEEEEVETVNDTDEDLLSTEMLAKEAIDHIESNDKEDLKGFVPDKESRVTVRRAWDEKFND